MNINNNNYNMQNKFRKIKRDFSKNFIFWKNDYFNYNNNNKNNNYQENQNHNFILPEIKRNNIIDSNNPRFNLGFHRNKSCIIKDNKYFSNVNKNTELQNQLLLNRFRNEIPINSRSYIFSNYIKNQKQNNDEYLNDKKNNQIITMANNDIIKRKNYFFDKIDNYNEYSNRFRPKMKIKRNNYYYNINDKFKNFGYGYFPDGNYRSIFSIK